MRKVIGRWLTAIGHGLMIDKSNGPIDNKSAERTEHKQLILRLTRETSSMPFEEAQDIVMNFSELIYQNGVVANRYLDAKKIDPNVVLEPSPLPRAECVIRGKDGAATVLPGIFYSRQPLAYSQEKAMRAFKVYFVNVLNAEAADEALHTLLTRVSNILPDGLEEPTPVEDYEKHSGLKEELWNTIAAEQSTLEAIRSVRHGTA